MSNKFYNVEVIVTDETGKGTRYVIPKAVDIGSASYKYPPERYDDLSHSNLPVFTSHYDLYFAFRAHPDARNVMYTVYVPPKPKPTKRGKSRKSKD